ncbi:hypothetical protein [Halobaculum lipolyticum]|uniref:Zinc ribbon domain-containing protein n=1 Tax=Halobaculum lipolyticum TaxID=3032001 RepID=A0ABD5WBX0_9EURY|nr:hypothetical protein [Halobaculum sp. DT31]
MTDRLHPLTAAGVGLCVGAVGLVVGGAPGLLAAGVALVVAGTATRRRAADSTSVPKTNCSNCGARVPTGETCEYCGATLEG